MSPNPAFAALMKTGCLQVFERGWLSSNNVLFDGGRESEAVLVDSGYASHAGQTVSLVERALAGRSLDRILNTHLHSDHCGGNNALQLRYTCDTDVPLGEAGKVDAWDESALTYRATGQSCPRFRRTGVLRDGQVVRLGSFDWHVRSAPGHDPESIVFHQPELALLISADALWENGFGVVFPELEGMHAFDDVRSTLHMLERLKVDWVIPGHGAPFRDAASALSRAHKRLDGFVADPIKHARYAAKVLIKFHMLEVQQVPASTLIQWIGSTDYLKQCHARYFSASAFLDWCDDLLNDLRHSAALTIHDGLVSNT